MIEELRAKAEALGIKVDGRWKESKLLQVVADASDKKREPLDIEDPAQPGKPYYSGPVEEVAQPTQSEAAQNRIDDMNALALRIWKGQSISELRSWRIDRVKIGLEKHGYSDILEHLSLPNA